MCHLLPLSLPLENKYTGGKFNLMIEALLSGNRYKTVGKSFYITSETTSAELQEFLNPYIENFEAQSGTGQDGPQTKESRVRIANITSSPNPEQIPFSSDPSNVQWTKETKAAAKTLKSSPTLQAIRGMESSIKNELSSLRPLGYLCR